MKCNVLITVPDLNLIGGKANYYSALNGLFEENVEYFTYGPRSDSKATGKFQKAKRLISDYWSFYNKLRKGNYDLVHVNPSLERNGFLRDSVFVFIASTLLGIKVLVFWRGWSPDFEKKVTGKLNWVFRLSYLKAEGMIVLADDFRKKLIGWNYRNPIFKETTVLDESLVEGFSKEDIEAKFSEKETRLLFMARIESNKGVFEILEAFDALNTKYPNLALTYGGTGGALNGLKQEVSDKTNCNVNLLGFVKGQQKRELLQKSHIFLFPSTHNEGLPNSVLEAMGCGMPVLTTWNAGIKDFFKDGEMGLVLENPTADHIKEKLSGLLENRDLQKQMAVNNYHYAQEHFVASKVVRRLEKIYRQIIGL